MEYFYNSIFIINSVIITFNLIKLTKNFLLLRANFKNSHIALSSFLKNPHGVYDEAIEKMDELEYILSDLIHTVHSGENLILLIDSIHSEIREKLVNLEDLDLLDKELKSRYDRLNNIFNQIFDRSQINIQNSYDIMDKASEYLKRG